MSLLKRKVIKTIPVWLLALILIGTAAGAFLWISNLVSTDVTVTNPPIEISGSFESVHYVGIETVSSFSYVLNNAILAVGYVVIDIVQTGMSLTQIGDISVRVLNDMGGDMTGFASGAEPINDGYRFVICDSATMSHFDFGSGGMATTGEIYVSITFESIGIYSVSMHISETAS